VPSSEPSPAPGDGRAASPWRWIGTLFFAEGLPATVIVTVAAILFKRLGVPNEDTALYTTGLMLPWIFRPLWAPLLEVFPSKAGFVVGSQIVLACGLAAVALSLAAEHPVPLCLAWFSVIAVVAATHDMAADGLYVMAMPKDVLPRYVAWLGVAFTAGKLTAQGLLVILAGLLEPKIGIVASWSVVFFVMAALMAALAVHHVFVLPRTEGAEVPAAPPAASAPEAASWIAVLATFVRKPHFVVAAGLVLFYRLSEGQLLRMVPLFILDEPSRGGLGLTTAEAGAVYGLFPAGAFMLGALAAGWLATRFGLARVLVPLCLVANLPTLVYVLLVWAHPRSTLVLSAVTISEQLAYGLGSIGLKLVMMQVLAPGPFTTAHLAFSTGLSSIGTAGGGVSAALIQARSGYGRFFLWSAVSALPAVLMSVLCARKLERSSPPRTHERT
jgi:PAT family beta-lactamase induction signal transducer AmpG